MRRMTMIALIIASLLLVAGCSSDKDETTEQAPAKVSQQIPVDISLETGYFGWDTTVLRNTYIELNVLPEYGGRIMGYDTFGSRMFWRDSTREGETGDFNPGGAWVYPAGADIGDWPAKNTSPYETMVYEAAYTDSTFTMTSPGDGDYRISVDGSIDPLSSIVRQRYTLERMASGSGQAGLRQVISLPVNGDVMVYAPVSNGGWSVIAGGEDNPQWLGVEEGVFHAKYGHRYGRVGLKLTEGWLAFRNASNGMTFVMRFPVEAGAYPGGYQVEIRSLGDGTGPDGQLTYSPETARMEVVIMGSLKNLDSGDTLTMNVMWESCRVSDIVKVLPNGILSQEFKMRDGKFSGKFGVFQGGHLQYVYLNGKKESIGYRNMYQINPLNEVIVDHGLEYFSFPATMSYLGFKAVDTRFNDLQVFGDIALPEK